MALKVDFSEKELMEIINNTITDEEYKKFIIKQINNKKINPIKGYGYGK